MRIITGSAKGRRLLAPAGLDTRPTTDMVKEAMCSAVQFDLPHATVLDLFAGSGQLGLEALSRGAEAATLVDADPKAIAVIRQNVDNCQMTARATVLRADAEAFLSRCQTVFDLAFLDPPYRKGILPHILPLLVPHMAANGILVCEHEPELALPEKIAEYDLKKQKKYGKIMVSVFQSSSEA